jgi:hypothetical protein
MFASRASSAWRARRRWWPGTSTGFTPPGIPPLCRLVGCGWGVGIWHVGAGGRNLPLWALHQGSHQGSHQGPHQGSHQGTPHQGSHQGPHQGSQQGSHRRILSPTRGPTRDPTRACWVGQNPGAPAAEGGLLNQRSGFCCWAGGPRATGRASRPLKQIRAFAALAPQVSSV